MPEEPDIWRVDASEPSSGDDLVAPVQIGNYKLVRRLGEGGMGIVYEAIQERPSRHVALKLMRQAVMTVEQRRRFERESQLLGGLVHPNIAQVYEAGTHKEGSISIPFYSMELVSDAKSVTAYANAQSLSRRARIELVIQICSAIQFAHDRAILHRDLKPNNILVGDGGSPKVIDMGVSRLMTDASIALTQTDQLVGTLAYMPPEQLTGAQDTPTVRWDVYALGIVLYELVVGQLPYRIPKDNPLRAARELEKAVPARPSSVDRTISKDLEAVVLKAIAKNPGERYAAIADLRDDLENVLAGKPVTALAHSWTKRMAQAARQFAQAHRVTALLVVSLAWLAICLFTPLRRATSVVDTAWPAFAMSHLNFVPDEPMQYVRMVSLRSDLRDVSASLGESTYDPAVRASARPLLGRLVERLAVANPRAIGLDYSFAEPSEYDAVFLKCLKEAEDGGIPIITCATKWKVDGGPGVIPELATRHRVGIAGVSEIYGRNFGLITVMIDEIQGDDPTFVAHVIAAARGIPRDGKVFVDYRGMLQGQKSDSERVDLGRVALLDGGPTGETFERGFSVNVAEVPSDSVMDQADIDFDLVMRMSDDDLRSTFADKVIIVGDARPNRDAILEVVPGRPVVGYRVNALVAEQALAGRQVRWTGQTTLLGVTVNSEFVGQIAAFACIVVTGLLLRTRRQLVLACATLALLAIFIPVFSYQVEGVILRSPASALALLLLLPILYGTRRWSAREQV